MIVRTRSGDMEYRTLMNELLSARRYGYGQSAGVSVTPITVSGVPAVHAAVSFSSEAVAMLPMRVWRGDGPVKERITTTWQARLFKRSSPNPLQSWFWFWEIVQGSLDYRNSAYIWKTKDETGRVVALTALHPDQIWPVRRVEKQDVIYQVTFNQLYYPTPPEVDFSGSVAVNSSTILHIRGRAGLGQLVPPTPIELFRAALGSAISKQEHEANLYKNGVAGGLVVSFPGGTTPQQADQWRENFDSKHAGPFNAGRTKVVGGGATVTEVGMTQRDAQFVESVELSVLDVSRIFRVPAWFLGVRQSTDKPATPEHEQQRWVHHGLSPRLARIEAAINADPDLLGYSDTYAAFDTAGIIRGDLSTQDTIAHQQIQDGRLLVDEWRIENGRAPLPDGLGMIPQIVPVGGAPNPITQGGKNNES